MCANADLKLGRVVLLIDMDCFYVQVEKSFDKSLNDKPICVVQYNPWKGGGILAVSYEARKYGVKRGMRGDEAKSVCEDLIICQVPENNGKADLSRYRSSSKVVMDIIGRYSNIFEKASIDEAFIDITDLVALKLNSYSYLEAYVKLFESIKIMGTDERTDIEELLKTLNMLDRNLIVASLISYEIKQTIFNETGFTCSIGVSTNKTISKLVAGMNKPNKISVVLSRYLFNFFENIDIKKIQYLGGEFGNIVCNKLKSNRVGEIYNYSEAEMELLFGSKRGKWLYGIIRGYSMDAVTIRSKPRSLSSCKNFKGPSALEDMKDINIWVNRFLCDLRNRSIEMDETSNEQPTKLSLSLNQRNFRYITRVVISNEFFLQFTDETLQNIVMKKLSEINSNQTKWSPPIEMMGLTISVFKPTVIHHNQPKVLHFLSSSSISPISSDLNKSNIIKPSLPNDNSFVCSKCNKTIMLDRLFEHEDYHTALELSVELPNKTKKRCQTLNDYFTKSS